MFQRILLAIDDSPVAERAAGYVGALALRFHSQVIVVSAYACSGASSDGHEGQVGLASVSQPARLAPPFFLTRKDSEVVVHKIVQQLHQMGIKGIETRVAAGPPAHVVLGAAESHRPDLIVLGARGRSTWQGTQLGGVSYAVLQRAEIPVLVIR